MIQQKKLSSTDIYLDIKEAVETLFDLQIIGQPSPLQLGYLNLKWKVETNKGILVIKQINKDRYVNYDFNHVLSEQDAALREQIRQYERGTLCPKILSKNGKVIHSSSGGEHFVVMEYVPGENKLPGTLNDQQMYSLGQMTGHMHRLFSERDIPIGAQPKFSPPSVKERLTHWETLADQTADNPAFLNLIERQIKATEQADLELIGSCQTGFAHRDLWVDNLLFEGDKLSSILDFDRFAYDYPELDIARAVMSGALHHQTLKIETVRAFLEGYRTKREYAEGTLGRSLQLLWYLESPWWVVPDINRDRYQEAQFQNEMVWLADHLNNWKEWAGNL